MALASVFVLVTAIAVGYRLGAKCMPEKYKKWKIVSKLFSYTDIIDSLDGKFATNMDMEEVTSFIKYELNDLKNYKIIIKK